MNADYSEAYRYFDNARENLMKAGIDTETKAYIDDKYVKTACGIAYNGVLKALDIYFSTKDVPKLRGRKSIEYYEHNLAKINKKHLKMFDEIYKILHLYGYYDGITNIKVIKAGMDLAKDLVKNLK